MKKGLFKNSGTLDKNTIKEVYTHKKSPHDQLMRTEGVSFPRSGQGALRKVFTLYFGSDFIYCADKDLENCGCGNVPCTNPNLNFSKNHDFEVARGEGCQIIPNQQYIIQYRNPIRSIVSDYRIFMKSNPDKDPAKFWFPFAQNKINYWKNFVDKWLLDKNIDHSLHLPISYEKLIANPEKVLKIAISFMTKQEPDTDRLQAALEYLDIKSRNRYEDFQFFDKEFFHKLEEQVEDRLDKLSIPSFEESV